MAMAEVDLSTVPTDAMVAELSKRFGAFVIGGQSPVTERMNVSFAEFSGNVFQCVGIVRALTMKLDCEIVGVLRTPYPGLPDDRDVGENHRV